jgi:hypothetical protein
LLELSSEIEKLRALYTAEKTEKFNGLIYGDMGSGKTRLIQTARLPILIDSFDPGGTKTLRDEINGVTPGWVIGAINADTRWELENPKKPSVAKDWEKEYERRKRDGIFGQLGTYVIDSVTTFSDCFANQYLASKNRAGDYLYQQDYNPIMAAISAAMKDILALPCDVIFIAHTDVDKDEVSGRMFAGPNFIGKSSRGKYPVWFDEIYAAVTKETKEGIEYSLLTQPSGMYKARTRLGKGGIFDTYEKPDIKALLRKAGISDADNPAWVKK